MSLHMALADFCRKKRLSHLSRLNGLSIIATYFYPSFLILACLTLCGCASNSIANTPSSLPLAELVEAISSQRVAQGQGASPSQAELSTPEQKYISGPK